MNSTGISSTHNIELDPIGDDREAWKLTQEVIDFRERFEATGHLKARLGVTWKNLTVEVLAGEAAVHENVLSQANLLRRLKESRHKPARRTILDNSHGCVKPGEMLLVLGRPGSGCTTLLKMLANKRDGYAAVTGDVHFGSMTAAEADSYRGQIVMNTEEETFYPSLTVKQTMDFATRLRIPSNLPGGVNPEDYRLEALSFLARSMGIEHTLETKVGDAFVRGVSGGERKRVSIIECLNSRASLFCWDNSTRGLDASSALDYVKAIRTISDVLGLTTIVTLYQAGNAIYDLFDKVLVLDSGKQVFYGPREVAKSFMEQLGFECEDGANVADFLTSVTVPTERKIRPGFEHRFPRNAEDLLEQYLKCPIRTQMETEYGYSALDTTRATTRQFQESVSLGKDASLPATSPMTVGILAQTKACVIRQYQIVWGDKFTLYTKQFMTVAQALIAGSLYYQAPPDSSGLFLKSGAAYFALLFNSLLAMTEVTDSFFGRPVLTKHKAFAYFHPASFCFAQVVSDVPVVIFQVTNFSIILYFMVGLRHTVAAFFTFWAHLILATLCFTALFRAIGACFKTVDGACKTAGFIVGAVTVYSGYIVQTSEMHPWFVWLFWINPFAYSFDALLSNEFYDRTIPCAGYNLIPSGPSYEDDRFQACAGVKGAKVGKPYVTGADYLSALSYGETHIWRNFGIVFAWWVLFVAITVVATTRWRSVATQGSRLVVPREKIDQKLRGRHADVERGTSGEKNKSRTTETLVMGETTSSNSSIGGEQVFQNTSIFTWKNLTYTVKTPSGERILLDNVQGWVKPGMLGALMGASGAGKTTLLDVLAQRKTEGTIRGSILVDGRPLAVSFQRSAGYCEQLDVHEPYATVREALEFSALLRQSRSTTREEKLNYVDTIIDLLELQDLADTLIGRVGAGLSVEQRKRVTIGVELVAKPAVLIFLDEPTSGLDGQSAYNTVRFLRKLANAGQSVLVTVHQPSAQLFTQFDTLLLLAKGGKTAYFGDIGPHAATLKSYFARHGASCPTNVNPADHMIDVISGGLSREKDWAEVWKSSPEHQAVTIELNRITEEGLTKPCNLTATEDFEFAVPLWEQVKIVSQRANTSLFRNTDYVNNKIELHIILGLFNGFTFWMIGDSFTELQARLFTIFNFIFVAPGAIAQLQPLFIDNRDVFEAREKKSKTYSWIAFVVGLIVSEFPYLVLSAILYFLCWYYTVGFPNTSDRAVGTLIIMICYEFIYTGIGQFIAAYSPNALTATLVNPLILGSLVATCGILVPYSQITAFWRYWLYWLNPFTYILGGMLTFASWGQEVRCKENELAVFNPPDGVTCGEYLENFLRDGFSNLLNGNATSQCKVCPYRSGSDYMISLNLNEYYYSWRDVALTALFAMTSYLFVFALMKLRTKASTKAE